MNSAWVAFRLKTVNNNRSILWNRFANNSMPSANEQKKKKKKKQYFIVSIAKCAVCRCLAMYKASFLLCFVFMPNLCHVFHSLSRSRTFSLFTFCFCVFVHVMWIINCSFWDITLTFASHLLPRHSTLTKNQDLFHIISFGFSFSWVGLGWVALGWIGSAAVLLLTLTYGIDSIWGSNEA